MNLRTLLILLLTALWFGGSWYWYTCRIKGLCSGTAAPDPTTQSQQSVDAPDAFPYPLSYQWNIAAPSLGSGYQAYLDSILALGTEGQTLTITGLAYEGEGGQSLGLARAKELQGLLGSALDTSRMQLAFAPLTGQAPAEGTYFQAAKFAWNDRPATASGNASSSARTAPDLPIRVYFAYKSTEPQRPAATDALLDQLVAYLQTEGGQLRLVGHADSIGPDGYNRQLGLQRARAVQAWLNSKGLPADRMQARSQGETQPIASNGTDDGRRQNRRVDITLP